MWNTLPLEQLLYTPIRNGLTKPQAIRGEGVKMIGMGELFANSRIGNIPMDRVPVDDKELSSSSVEENDLLFARQSLVLEGAGKCSIVTAVDEDTVFESHLIRVRIDPDKALPGFLYYYFNSFSGREQIKGIVEQVAAAGIRGKDLIKLKVPVPPLSEQEKIVNLLDEIDRKIEADKRANVYLLEQAQLLFASWFITFDRNNKKQPDAWKTSKLGSIARIITKSYNPQKHQGEIVEYYSIPAFDESKFPVFENAERIKSNKYLLTKESVMISKLNPNIKRVWRPICMTDTPVCSTEFIVYEAKDKGHKDFLFSLINSRPFSDFMCANVTGSTGSRQRTIPKATLDYEFPMPNEATILEFCKIVSPMYDLIASNQKEIQEWNEARILLNDKLMAQKLSLENIQIA